MKGRKPVVAVTAYDAITARLASEAGVDLLLVGDSVGTTLLGFETTVPVTLAMMLHHTAAVTRARPEALVVADLPFPHSHRSPDALLEACATLMQAGGAEAVKLEGGAAIAGRVEMLVGAGVAVLGHVGLLPQQVFRLGGYRKFGKTPEERAALLEDVRALEAAGVFGIVAEMVDAEAAAAMTAAVGVPIIGIGCGHPCDGQILVSVDLLGMNPGKVPGFVREYADVKTVMRQAFATYASEVREGAFPPS